MHFNQIYSKYETKQNVKNMIRNILGRYLQILPDITGASETARILIAPISWN